MNVRKDTTLADHLGVIRGSAGLIVLVGIVCAALGLGLSLVQKKKYEATASVAVSDPNTALAIVGSPGYSVDTPLQLASIHAPTVTRPAVLAAVDAALHSTLSPAALKSTVAIGVDPNSYAVTIAATDTSATLAAQIANAFATADSNLSNATARAGYAAQYTTLSRQLGKSATSADSSTAAIDQQKLSTLKSLASIASPVQVASVAAVPSSPSSPKPVRNGVAAFIFGLLAGVAIAYLRRALDRRFRNAEDVEARINLPIVGRIRREALGHAGADNARHSDFAPIDSEAFRILRHNVQFLATGEALGSLLITSSVAEEGKSTVAACIALSYAEAGQRTMLIECDLRRPVLMRRFGLTGQLGLTDYLSGHATPPQILQVVDAAPSRTSESGVAEPNQLVCITAGSAAPNPSNLLASDRFRTLLQEVTEAYDIVIIDSAPLLSVADTLEIVPYVSGVLMCLRVDQTTHDQARSAYEALTRLPPRPTGLVLTNLHLRTDEYYGYYSTEPRTAIRA